MTIDNKVVSMTFDNQQFENGAKDTLRTIDDLNEALKFSDASSGFENITNAASNVRFDGLSTAISSVGIDFSNLEIVAINVLSNIVNQAVAAGAQLVKSLTITPILQGFNEYESKMGSIQTILANVNAAAKASQESTSAAVSDAATSTASSMAAQKKAAQKTLKATQKEETKALKERYNLELSEYQKAADEQLKALEERKKEETASLEDIHDEQLKQIQAEQKEEQKALKNSYNQQLKDLKSSQEEQLKTLRAAHNERLDMYEEEYMAKIKAIDEERYNELKAIQDQIDQLEELTDAEDKAARASAQQDKLAELERQASIARSARRREETEKALADYKKELEQEAAQDERKAQIKSLKDQMDVVNDIYDERIDSAKEEYQEQKQLENDQYDVQYDALRETQQAEREAAQELYQQQLEALQEQYSTRKDLLQEQYDYEREQLLAMYQEQKDELQDRIKTEKQAIQDRRSDEQDALNEKHSDEMDAINEQYTTTTSNITATKNLALGAVGSVKRAVEEVELEDVTAALDELNEYADKTKYSFADMTSNIAKFTVAGIGLQDSVDSIKGLANIAALAGADAWQTSNAMYQLSQAMATGKVLLRDWISLENSGIGGKVFQESLKETARVHGIAVDDIIAKEGSFRNSLSTGWLSADIMIETLRKFTGELSDEELAAMGYTEEQIKNIQETAQNALDAATKVRTLTQFMSTLMESIGSGWAKTFEIVVGDFNEATNLWTSLSQFMDKIVGAQADARNELLQGWADAGGRDTFLSALKNLWENVELIAQTARVTFGKVFEGPTVQGLLDFTRSFDKLTRKFKISYDTLNKFSRILSGLLSVIDIAKIGFKALFDILSPGIGIVGSIVDVFLDIAASIGDWLYNLDQLLRTEGGFQTFVNGISEFTKDAAKAISGMIEAIAGWAKMNVGTPSVDFIVDFVTNLKNGLAPIGQIFGGILYAITEFLTGVQLDFSDSGSFVSSILTAIGTFGQDILGALGSIPGQIKELATQIWTNIKNFFSGTETEVEEGSSGIDAIFDALETGLDGIISVLSQAIDGIAILGTKIVKAVKKLVGTVFAGIDYTDILKGLGVVNAGAMTSVLLSFSDFIKTLQKFFSGGLSDKSGKTEIDVDYMKSLAAALAILAAAMLLMTQVDTEKLKIAMIAIAECMGGLAGTMAVLGKVGNTTLEINREGLTKTSNDLGKSMVKFAAAILIMAFALKQLDGLDSKNIEQNAKVLAALCGDLVLSIGALTGASSLMPGGDINGLIPFAIAMGLLVAELKWISNTPFAQYQEGLEAMAWLAGGLTGAISLLNLASSEAQGAKINGLIPFVIAMGLLVAELKWASNTPFSTYESGLEAMLVLASTLDLSVIALKKSDSETEGAKLDGVISFAISMGILVAELKWLSSTDCDDIVKGLSGMVSLAAIMVIAIKKIYQASDAAKKGNIDGLLEFAAAMGILAFSLKSIAELKFWDMVQGLIGLAGAAAVMVASLTLLYGFTSNAPSGSLLLCAEAILAMAGAMLVLTPAMMALSQLSIGELAVAIGAMAATLAVLGVAGYALAPVTPIIMALAASIGKFGLGIAGIGVGILALAGALLVLSTVGSTAVVGFLGTISLLFEGILDILINSTEKIMELVVTLITSACGAAVETIPMIVDTVLTVLNTVFDSLIDKGAPLVDKVLTFILLIVDLLTLRVPEIVAKIMTFVGTIIVAIVNELAKYDLSPFVTALENFGLITGFVALIAGVGKLAGAAAAGIVKIGVVITELIAVLSIIGLIANLPGLEWLINEGGDFLGKVGGAIGKFVGGIIGGFGEELSNSLPAIGENLSSFMDSLQGFIDGTSKIDASILDGVKTLVEVMLLLTGAELLETVKSFFMGDNKESPLVAFAAELLLFADPFAQFYEKIKDVKPDVVEGAANAAAALTKMAKGIPNEGGLVAKVTGDNSLSMFAEELEKFGTPFANFYTAIKDINPDVVKAAADAASALTAMAKGIPNEGGLVSRVTGDNSLSAFAAELVLFGPSLMLFSLSVQDLKQDAIEKSLTCATIIKDFADTLPPTGGLKQVWDGTNSLSSFAAELAVFGPSLKTYSDSVSGVNEDAVLASGIAASALASAVSALPTTGGIKSVWDGSKTLSSMAEELVTFGPAIKSYSDSIQGIDPVAVAASGYAGQALASLNAALPESGGIFSWFTGKKDLGDFADNLEELGEALSKYDASITNVNAEDLDKATEQVSKLVDIARDISEVDLDNMSWFGDTLTEFARQGINGFVEAFDGCYDTVKQTLQTFVDFCGEKIGEFKENLKQPGIDTANVLLNAFSSAIVDNVETSRERLRWLIEDMKTTMSDNMKQRDFNKYGQSVVYWIKDGITDNLYYLTNYLHTFCETHIIQKINDELPKKTILDIGKNIVFWIHDGITSYTYYAKSAAGTMAGNVKTAVTDILNKHNFMDIARVIIQEGFGEGFWTHKDDADQTIYKVASEIKGEFTAVLSKSAFNDIAGDVMDGLIDGLNDTDRQNKLSNASKNVAKTVEDSTKKQLEIHSPSGKFEKIAEYIVQGFALGFRSKMLEVANLGVGLSDTVIDPVQAAISQISDSMDSINSSDFTPTIRPVVDLTNVNNAAGVIDSSFGNWQLGGMTYGLAQSAYSGFNAARYGSTTYETTDKMLGEKLDKLNDTIADNNKTENYNNFYIQSTDPKKAAEEVGYIMQHKVDRRRAVWAK